VSFDACLFLFLIMKTYLLYDLETSGLNPAFDQILTFAAIRTDTNFNELERHSFTIQLRPDIVPSPQACIVHRLSYDDLKDGLPEYDAVKQIHEIVNKPGTVSLGYNTLRFDDEFLRFSFYRNLLDPYIHQYGNGCSRMDILPLATLYYVFKQEILKWPLNNGKPSLKLEKISEENVLVTSGRAHEAMTDVEATCNLAQFFLTIFFLGGHSRGMAIREGVTFPSLGGGANSFLCHFLGGG